MKKKPTKEKVNLPRTIHEDCLKELERFRAAGIPFKFPELAARLSCDRSSARIHSRAFVIQLFADLAKAKVTSSVEYENWKRDFLTFRAFTQTTLNAQAIIRKFYRLTIEDFNRKGIVRFAKVYAVTGGNKKNVREELNRWENETGQKVVKRQEWRYLYKEQIGENEADLGSIEAFSRDTIYKELDRRRAIGTPFRLKEVAQVLGFSQNPISEHSRFYVGNIADELLNKTVSTTDEYFEWKKLFNTFQHSLRNTWKRNELLLLNIRLSIEHLVRQNIPVGRAEITRLTGSNDQLIGKAIKIWEQDTGTKVDTLPTWKTITLEMVLNSVSPQLHSLPLTFLEDPAIGRAFTTSQLRMIFSISQPKLRDTAFFVMTFADGNRRNDITFFSRLSKYLLNLSIRDIDLIETERFYTEYHDGVILPSEKPSMRLTFLQTYFRLLKKQKDYFLKLTPDQLAWVAPYSLAGVSDVHFWQRSQKHKEVRQEQIIRRKAMTDAVHEKFYLLRDIAERRRIQLERMVEAYAQAIKHHQNTQCELPYRFSITDESVLSSGGIKTVCHHFRLWNARSLRHVHQPLSTDFYDSASPYQKSISEKLDLYFLEYEGGYLDGQTDNAEPYWFTELLHKKSYGEANQEFKSVHGISEQDMVRIPEKSDWDTSIGWWHSRLHTDLGFKFIPTNALMRAAYVGHAAIQLMTKTGVRMNEFLQIRLTSECLRRVSLAEDQETIAFWAIPKGRTSEEPYYIDERCMKALHAWWSFQRAAGEVFGSVEPTRPLSHKLKPAPYLWQMAGRHLSHRDINACMRFLLFGTNICAADGSVVSLSSHLFRHGFATELRALNTPVDVIALLLKQRDVKVTDYYSRPTPKMLVDMQKKIFESRVDLTRVHIRSAKQIQTQIEAAKEKIGALIPVAGGICTVASPCPAKFACVGCAGNAPDPAKRQQVFEIKNAYKGMASMAQTQKLPAERRKAMEIISHCDDLLAEMDLIDQVDKAAAEPVILRTGIDNE